MNRGMPLLIRVDLAIIKLVSAAVRLLFLALAAAYAIGFGLIAPLWLVVVPTGAIRDQFPSLPWVVALIPSVGVIVAFCVYIVFRMPALAGALAGVGRSILALGEAVGTQVEGVKVWPPVQPLSIEQVLRRKTAKLEVSLIRPEQDPMEVEDAVHQQLRRALAGRDVSAFSSLLGQVKDVDAKRDELQNPQRALLLDAAEAGATELVGRALERGARINQADTYRGGLTALHLASQNGHYETVKLLLERGAEPNLRDQWGHTALWYAALCHGGHPEVVRLLLSKGADPAAQDEQGRSVLQWATLDQPTGKRAEVVSVLRRMIDR